MRTNLATRAGMLGVASAAALALPLAPAQAATAAPQTAAASATAQAVAKPAKWVTLKHQSRRTTFWNPRWDRKYGHRVMQVQARCWGRGRTMYVTFDYRNQYRHWKAMKRATWPCDGRYRYLRVTNAGHKKYGATFSLPVPQTVEYWAQSYG